MEAPVGSRRLCPALAEDGLNVPEDCRPLIGVEFHDLTNQDGDRTTGACVGRTRVIGKPKCPSCKRLKVQAIELGEFEEHNRIGLLDKSPFDLG